MVWVGSCGFLRAIIIKVEFSFGLCLLWQNERKAEDSQRKSGQIPPSSFICTNRAWWHSWHDVYTTVKNPCFDVLSNLMSIFGSLVNLFLQVGRSNRTDTKSGTRNPIVSRTDVYSCPRLIQICLFSWWFFHGVFFDLCRSFCITDTVEFCSN